MDYENKHREEIVRATQLWECGDITRENLEYIFPELCESDDEKIRNVIRGWIYTQPASFFDNGISKEEILAWLEKKGEQKPANNVKPKFSVGDWVVFNNKHQSIYQVKKIENDYYILRHTHGGSFRVCVLHDESLRLWSIEDAKDGDVLVGSYGIFIFMNKSNGYCGVLSDNTFIRSTGNNEWTEGLHPATKEQRDTLEKAMANAGYTFNFEEKVLEKIRQKSNDRLDPLIDEEIDLWIKENSDIHHDNNNIVELMRDMAHYIATLTRNLYRQKPKWSEEDEIRLDRICKTLWKNRKGDTDEKFQQEQDVDWLKSIKKRMEE